jgi:hypothetical protein
VIDGWLKANCVRHPDISGGVVVLLRYMNASLAKQHHKGCSLDQFKSLLERKGLKVVEVSGTLLVLGAGLKWDRDLLEWLKITHATEKRRRLWDFISEPS